MSRIIRFRTWDTKNKKFLEFIPPEKYMLDTDEWSHSDDMATLKYPDCPLPDFEGRLIHQQFTGALDKNGREIYEGDIMKYELRNSYGTDILGTYFGEVYYDAPATRYSISNVGGIKLSVCEIIGNRFDNPDLYNRYGILPNITK